MNTLREACPLCGVLILLIWAHTDEYRHECLDDRYCSEQNDE